MQQATFIINVNGNDNDALIEGLIETIKTIVNEGGACGSGKNGAGTSFEFSTLYSGQPTRRGQIERTLGLTTKAMDLAKELIDGKLVATKEQDAAIAEDDERRRAEINAKNNPEKAEKPTDDLAETLGKIFGVILADIEGKGVTKH